MYKLLVPERDYYLHQNPPEREGAAGTGQVGELHMRRRRESRVCRHRQCQRGEGARDGPDQEIYPEMRERVLHGPHQRIWYLVTVPRVQGRDEGRPSRQTEKR